MPYTSANPGDRHYTGWSRQGKDYIEPHVVGEDGYAYLRLYEMTGNTKYLRAAIRCAEALAKNYKSGDAKISQFPNMGVLLLSCITPSAITRGWPTDSSAQQRAILETQAWSSGASAWAAC